MYGLTTIHKLNEQAAQAAEILKNTKPKSAEEIAKEDAEIGRLIAEKAAAREAKAAN